MAAKRCPNCDGGDPASSTLCPKCREDAWSAFHGYCRHSDSGGLACRECALLAIVRMKAQLDGLRVAFGLAMQREEQAVEDYHQISAMLESCKHDLDYRNCAECSHPAAALLGSMRSPRKAASSRANGKKGGRPKNTKT